jgi:colicin import membrane protein
MSAIGRSKGKIWGIAIWLIGALVYSTPALTQRVGSKPPPEVAAAAALDAAAEKHDRAGELYGKAAWDADERNGQQEQLPLLRVDRYRDAATADEKAAKQFEQAAKDWKEAADQYKAALAAIKEHKEGEADQLRKKITSRQKRAERLNEKAIQAYKAAAIERDKAAIGISEADRVVELDKAAANREAAAHVGKASKDSKDSKEE